MILKDSETKIETGRFSLEDQAKALAMVLSEEFDTTFSFFDAATSEPVSWTGEPTSTESAHAIDSCSSANAVSSVTSDGKAHVVPLSEYRYQVALLLHESGKPVLVAIGELTGVARTVPEAVEERERLRKWAQAVSDRLRVSDQLLSRRCQDEEQSSSVHAAWEVALTAAQLARTVRIHREPVKNRQRIVEAASRLLGAQSIAWVPNQPDVPVLIQGDSVLAPAEWRNLGAALSKEPNEHAQEPIILNDFSRRSGAVLFPSVTNLIAFQINDQGLVGWLVAVNKKVPGQSTTPTNKSTNGDAGPQPIEITPFRRSDAALLLPFVALLEMHARGSRRYQDLKDLLVGLTRSLTAALDAKDSYTYGHSERVARIAVELGRELGMEGDELAEVYLAGLLHDVGKIGIRDAVLGKIEALTPEEFEHIKGHVTIGYTILSELRQIRNLLPGVLYHHERWDGRGYPQGLTGEAIPQLARILAVADAYDAMSTTRPYRDAIPCRRVEEIIQSGAGTQWDKKVVEAFLRCKQKIHTIRQRGVGDSLQQIIERAIHIDQSLSQWKSDAFPRLP